jgi:hypothetical protein
MIPGRSKDERKQKEQAHQNHTAEHMQQDHTGEYYDTTPEFISQSAPPKTDILEVELMSQNIAIMESPLPRSSTFIPMIQHSQAYVRFPRACLWAEDSD